MDLTRGFLPTDDPLDILPDAFAEWEYLACELPKLLVSNKLRTTFRDAPLFPVKALGSEDEYRRAMVILSFIGHAYVWGEPEPVHTLPKSIAQPWYQVAAKLGRPPVMSYASYALDNWQRIDSDGPIAVGNISLLQNFLAGIDEEWFVLIHVDIEAKAIPAIQAIRPLIHAVVDNQLEEVVQHLETIRSAFAQICDVMGRMPEHCDPYVYYNRVRPYIHGWKDNPALPNGLIYEAVSEYNKQPQKFRGETGAQSAIIPCFDALLGVDHRDDPLMQYLQEMRTYMPAEQREFLESIERTANLREYVLSNKDHAALKQVYNDCIELIAQFRKIHLHYAAVYINKQVQTSKANPTETGTGGTPFMQYLKKHLDEVLEYVV